MRTPSTGCQHTSKHGECIATITPSAGLYSIIDDFHLQDQLEQLGMCCGG